MKCGARVDKGWNGVPFPEASRPDWDAPFAAQDELSTPLQHRGECLRMER